MSPPCPLTSTGFLRRMKKFSALIIIKRMNLWHKIFSISSAWREKREVRLPQRLSCSPCPNPPHLLHRDADAHRVNGALDENLLLLVPADDHRLQQQLFAAPANRGRAGVTQREAFTGGKQGGSRRDAGGVGALLHDAPASRRCCSLLDPLPPPAVPRLSAGTGAVPEGRGCPRHGRKGPGLPRCSLPAPYLTSTSGLLCRSTTCEEKFSRHSAACSVARTAFRYGRSVAVCGDTAAAASQPRPERGARGSTPVPAPAPAARSPPSSARSAGPGSDLPQPPPPVPARPPPYHGGGGAPVRPGGSGRSPLPGCAAPPTAAGGRGRRREAPALRPGPPAARSGWRRRDSAGLPPRRAALGTRLSALPY